MSVDVQVCVHVHIHKICNYDNIVCVLHVHIHDNIHVCTTEQHFRLTFDYVQQVHHTISIHVHVNK